MNRIDEAIERLEARIAQAEAFARALVDENMRLKSALAQQREGGAALAQQTERGAGAPLQADAAPVDASRSMRLAVLEAERHDVRSRLRGLLETF